MSNNNTETTALRLGDSITGFYFDVPFSGKLVGFEGVGMTVRLAAPIVVMGRTEDQNIWLKNNESNRRQIVVTSSPGVTEDQISESDGYVFLR